VPATPEGAAGGAGKWGWPECDAAGVQVSCPGTVAALPCNGTPAHQGQVKGVRRQPLSLADYRIKFKKRPAGVSDLRTGRPMAAAGQAAFPVIGATGVGRAFTDIRKAGVALP
jgi:hypothetical protein